MNDDCIFCKIAKGDIPVQVVYEDDDMIAFDDINPQAPIHCVFVAKEHIPTLNDLPGVDSSLIGKMHLAMVKVAKEKGIADTGYRIVANCNKDGGQEVFHLHYHLMGGRGLNWPPG